MCGIVGYIGKKQAAPILLDGLSKLEYRGYDSAGMAIFDGKKINMAKATGRLKVLSELTHEGATLPGTVGIGHTRWATHGAPSDINAHPHFNEAGTIAVVHNGIIENYMKLKKKLSEKGYKFQSDTDTEVVAQLLDYYYTGDPLETITKVMHRVEGSYALGIIFAENPDVIYAVRKDSPLIVGRGEGENLIASDVPAILKYTRDVYFIENEEIARLSEEKIEFFNVDGESIEKECRHIEWDIHAAEKGGYEHFMLKEMHEQPEVFKKTTEKYISNGMDSLIEKMPDFSKYGRIRIVACGSATHAGLVGKQMIEKYANVEVRVDTASEFRYGKQFLKDDELVIVVSQSGETADTLEALNIAKKNGNDTLGIVNAKGSTIAREAKMVLYTEAGQEIAVATTKAYSAQVALLSLIALNLSYKKNLTNKDEIIEILKDAKKLPDYIEELLNRTDVYKKIAEDIKDQNDIFFIGRGVDYALAEEGSLKLKEISYTHSEAYAAGELKHGTISLIEDKTPVVAVITDEKIAPKTISNVKEVKSRGANVICITSCDSLGEDVCDEKIVIPKVNYLFEPLLAVIPLQMIAYELAKIKGCSIDKPKNLAKSVTVE